jgi:hypothetical protein
MSVNQSDVSTPTGSTTGSGSATTSSSRNAPDPSLRDRAGDAYDSARTGPSALMTARANGPRPRPPGPATGSTKRRWSRSPAGSRSACCSPPCSRAPRRRTSCSARSADASPAARATRSTPPRKPGRDKLNELNLTREAGSSTLQTLIKSVSDAALGAAKRPAE